MKSLYLRFLSMAVFVMASHPLLAYDCIVDGIYYDLDTLEHTATVALFDFDEYGRSVGQEDKSAVVIPSSIVYNGVTFSVTSISRYAFKDCSSLTSVTIPENVVDIEYYAFGYCSGLTSISVDSNNSKYDSRNNCNAIIETTSNTLITGCKNTVIPNSVTSIGDGAFSNRYDMTSIAIPNSVTSIGSHAFEGCRGLTSFTIPNSVTSIGDGAFNTCSGLTSITIPNSVTSIGDGAFSGCRSLASVTFPSGLKEINSMLFWYCSSLTSVTIPDGVTSIGNNAFAWCTSLTSVTIPENVTSIDFEAFAGCRNLSLMTIPESVTSVGDGAFFETAWYSNQPDGLVYAGKVAYSYKGTMPEGTDIVIKDGTTAIAPNAFRDCNGLACVTLPNSVRTIEWGAFMNCSGLTSINIPGSVTTIGENAFSDCASLISVNIPEGVVCIKSAAFQSCSGLTSLTLPNSLKNISINTFQGCTSLSSVTIPESVTSIGYGAFLGADSVFFGDNVAYIGDSNSDFSWVGRYPFYLNSPLFVNQGSRSHLALWFCNYNYHNLYQKTLYRKDNQEKIEPVGITPTTLTFPTLDESSPATIVSQTCEYDGNTVQGYELTGLEPKWKGSVTYTVQILEADGKSQTLVSKMKLETNALEFTSIESKEIAQGNVVVAAMTNLDEREENVGFEWRQTEWTDDQESMSAKARLSQGVMECTISKLDMEKPWQYRPYYEALSGKRFYGEWVSVIPTSVHSIKATHSMPSYPYDLSGRRLVATPTKGLYIENGKKKVSR